MTGELNHEEYEKIGKCHCATVWAAPTGNSFAIKREDGGPGRSVHNDAVMHQKVLAASPPSNLICVTKFHKYID